MMLHVREVLTREEAAQCRDAFDAARARAPWRDDSPVARALGDTILDALARNATFFAAALPLKVFPPRFECAGRADGDAGPRVADALRVLGDSGFRVRGDLAATLFLADPDRYDGGELCIADTYGTRRAKLPAGDLLLYPASGVQRVTPVARGARVVASLSIQSMIRDDTERALLHQLDNDVQRLGAELGANDPRVVSLTGLYHNLLRHWARS